MRLRTKILIAAPLIIILLAAAGITAGLAINSNIRQSRYNDVLEITDRERSAQYGKMTTAAFIW